MCVHAIFVRFGYFCCFYVLFIHLLIFEREKENLKEGA